MSRLEGRDIVCFANDWSGDPLSKKHVMRRLARSNRVLWVDSLGNRAPRANARDFRRIITKLQKFTSGLRPVEPNIHVLTPLAIPAYGAEWVKRVNAALVGATVRAAMRRLGFERPILYTFVPASAWVASELGAERVVYHCVDEYAAFDGAGLEIARLEEELIRKSDLVITCSEPLQRTKAALHPRTVLVRHGVEHDRFAKALDEKTRVPEELEALPRPRFGFYGLIAEWVDLEAMEAVARAFPDGSVALVGAVNGARHEALARLSSLPNVRLFGRRPYVELPGFCKGLDVALLPFVKSTLTENANPLKLREYLAAGLPVVSSDLPEARALVERGVYLAEGGEGFVEACRRALADGGGPSAARSAAMADESWDAKVNEIERELMELLHTNTPARRGRERAS
jgi:glycosyltransferase involved in cell wall biosynthesis